MVNGVGPDKTHYYPSFPYSSYANARIEDILHLKAYLHSLPPVERDAIPHELRFPFNFRIGPAIWKFLFHDVGPVEITPGKERTMESGRIHCQRVRSLRSMPLTKNLFFAEVASRKLTGGSPLKPGEKEAPGLIGLSAEKILNGLDVWAGSVSKNSSMHLVTEVIFEFRSIRGSYCRSRVYFEFSKRITSAAYNRNWISSA